MEFEVKVRVDDLEAVETKLKSLGWVLKEQLLERDAYVDFTVCAGIPAKETAFRIRSRVDLMSGAVSGEVTFKGRLVRSDVKAREEINVVVKDPEKLSEAFTLLGFQIHTVEKLRKVYVNEGSKIRVFLDRVKGLGDFIEFEVLGDVEGFLEEVEKLKESLNLSGRENIVKSYLELILEGGND